MPFGAAMYFDPRRDKIHLLQFGATILPRLFTGNVLKPGGCWTGFLIIVDWYDIENNFASIVHEKKLHSSPRECESRNWHGKYLSFVTQTVPWDWMVPHNVKRYAFQEPNDSSTPDFGRGVSLYTAQSVPLGKRMAKLRMFLNPPWKS